MSIQRPLCFFNLCSSCSSRSNKRRRDCLLPPPCGRLCCCAGLTARPYSHRCPAIPLLTHTCCYSPATAYEPVNPRTVILTSAWETTAESSLPPCRRLPRPRRCPPPWCSWRSVVNVVKERLPSDVECTWRGRQLGPRPQQGSASLLHGK